MKRLLAMWFTLGLLLIACGGATDSSPEVASPTGDPLPDFTATTVSGSQISANDLEGSDVVLWFWAPW